MPPNSYHFDRYYRAIFARNVEALQQNTGGTHVSLKNIMVQLLKCCNHTFLIEGARAAASTPDASTRKGHTSLQTLLKHSGKLYVLHSLLKQLKQEGHRVLIFSQMVCLHLGGGGWAYSNGAGANAGYFVRIHGSGWL